MIRLCGTFFRRIEFWLIAGSVFTTIAMAAPMQSSSSHTSERTRWVATLNAKRISVAWEGATITSALAEIARKCAVPIQLLEQDRPAGSVGIDPALTIELHMKDTCALHILDRITQLTADASGNECRWQTTAQGIELGPKARLLRTSALERRVYLVADLAFRAADFQVPPLQSGGGGAPPVQPDEKNARYQKIKNLIQSTVETDVWQDNASGPCTIALFNNSLIVIAPDFVHREIAGSRIGGLSQPAIQNPTR